MRHCPVVMSARMRVGDKIDPTAALVPVAFHTDGQWIWTAEAVAYVERYGMSAPEDFIEHAARCNFHPPAVLTVETRTRVIAEVRRQGQAEDEK